MNQHRFVHLSAGDPLPWFTQDNTSSEEFQIQTTGGRYLLFAFFGSAADAGGQAMLTVAQRGRHFFDDLKIAFFGVSVSPDDQKAVKQELPGIRHFWDFDGSVSRACGAVSLDLSMAYRRLWMIVNPDLRIRAVMEATGEDAGVGAVLAALEALPALDQYNGFTAQAPILILPNVFDEERCKSLIKMYQDAGGRESGFMRDIDGKTVEVMDRSHKSRSDFIISDEELQQQIQTIFRRRVVPEIKKTHQFDVTRMERYLIGCYDAENGGHFNQHRDNTTKGTAHRRFAVSVNLNDDFDGGEVRFPEYGPRGYKAPPGGAVVFSCSLLHAVSPITRGKRFAFLPFLYDEAAARMREANAAHLAAGSDYRAVG